MYKRELQAFSSAATTLSAPSNEDSGCGRDGDAGECWYGDDVTSKMVELILPYCVPTARVLDIGTGNGDLICRLVESAPMSWYIGTDYSANAVKLAKAVTEARGGQQVEMHIITKVHVFFICFMFLCFICMCTPVQIFFVHYFFL